MSRFAILLFGLLWLMAVTGCGGAPPLAGAWELISENPEAADEKPVTQLARPVKVLSKTHWAFGNRTADGTVAAGGGRYTLKDGVYTEQVAYHWMPALIGLAIEFDCRLDGNLWYHEGIFEVGDRRFVISEVWRRIEE